jgi:hypothetical protein
MVFEAVFEAMFEIALEALKWVWQHDFPGQTD